MSQPTMPQPDPRRYRIQPVADAHQLESERMINNVARRAVPGRALVLGAGECREIPLADLANRFAQVVLNDLEVAPLEAGVAARSLSDEPRARTTLQAGDATGLLAPTRETFARAVARADTAEQAVEALASTAQAIAVPVTFANSARDMRAAAVALLGNLGLDRLPQDRAPFNLVVASCLISQLHAPLLHAAETALVEKFPDARDALRQSPRWQQAIAALAQAIEDRFLLALPGLLAPGGRIYFSETVQTSFVDLADDGAWLTAGTLRMTRTANLADYVQPPLEIEELGRWTWVSDVPTTDKRGRIFDVQALGLRLKA